MLGSLVACGDDEEGLSPFCDEVRATDEEFAEAGDVAGFGAALGDLDSEPPEEIAEDWTLVLDNWDELTEEDGAGDVDGENLEEVEAMADRRQELETAWRAVSSYLSDVCAMDLA